MDNTINPESFLLDNKVKKIENAKIKSDNKGIKEAAQEFESFFVYYLIKKMRDSLPKSGFLPESKGESVYTSLYDQELSKSIAKKGDFGFSRLIISQMMEKSKDK